MPRPLSALATIIGHEKEALTRTAEYKLWVEVLTLSWHDAFHRLEVDAIQFFLNTSGVFHDVCELLDLPETAIRERLQKVITNKRLRNSEYQRYRRSNAEREPAPPAPSPTQFNWTSTTL